MQTWYEKFEQKFLYVSIVAMLFLIYCKYLNQDLLSLNYQLPIAIVAYILVAADVCVSALKALFKQKRMTEQFLMVIATLGAFALLDLPEALAVMIFYKVGELFERYAKGRAHKDISSLLSLRPQQVRLLVDGVEKIVKPRQVKIGDTIRILKGEIVAIDGTLLEDNAAIDTKVLTGESEPRLYVKGDVIPSGCINQGGVITLKVTTLHKDSSITRLLNLIEDAQANKSKPEDLIRRFSIYYTPMVVTAAVLLALVPVVVQGQSYADWIERALVFLVVSCPCALVLSVPLSFFCGLGALSKLGVIVKGSVYLEVLSKIKKIAFDKTGTLTYGNFAVVNTYLFNDFSKDDLLSYAYALETYSTHPIALSICEYAKKQNTKLLTLTDVHEHSGLGMSAKLGEQKIALGKSEYIKDLVDNFENVASEKSLVYVACDHKLCGVIELFDEVRQSAKATIKELNKDGIDSYIVSGDREGVVAVVAKTLQVKGYFAKQTPEDKLKTFKSLQQDKSKVAFVGDGINDALVLTSADLGIAMGDVGSKSAVESADVVILNDNLQSISKSIFIAKKVYHLALTNLWFVMLVKAAILLLGSLGIANIWLAIFGDVGVLVLAVLNAMRASRFK